MSYHILTLNCDEPQFSIFSPAGGIADEKEAERIRQILCDILGNHYHIMTDQDIMAYRTLYGRYPDKKDYVMELGVD